MPILHNGVFSLSPQHLVEEDCKAWQKVWLKFVTSATAPWRDCGPLTVCALQPIQIEDFRRVAGTYKCHTGLGCEDFHLRWFGWLSDEVLEGFARFLMAIEQHCRTSWSR